MGDSGTVTLGQPFFQDATPGGGGVLTSAGPGGVPWWIWLMGGVLAFQMSALVGWIFVLAMLLTMLGPGLQSINNFAIDYQRKERLAAPAPVHYVPSFNFHLHAPCL